MIPESTARIAIDAAFPQYPPIPSAAALFRSHGTIDGTWQGDGVPYYPGDQLFLDPATMGLVVVHPDGTRDVEPPPPIPLGVFLPPVAT